MYGIVFTRNASKSFLKLPKRIRLQINEKISEIAKDPYAFHANVTKLQNRPGYRLRIGDWRVMYDIQEDKLIIIVMKIGLRGEVYR